MGDTLEELEALCDCATAVLVSIDADLLRCAINEIKQLRAVAGQARGTEEGSLAAIRQEIDHG